MKLLALLALAVAACGPLERADDAGRRREQSEALERQENARSVIVGEPERH